ncbi:MAG: peptidylprolyl isomerase [Clostridium sp.]|nr:peptidylprolyl isomerase [Clostridium sp.]
MKIIKKIILAATVCTAIIATVGCTKDESSENIKGELPIAKIVVKEYGTIEAELYPSKAPNTVNNFISLANSGFYDGLTFHRIIDGFMIQGGDPKGNGTGGPGYAIEGEFSSNGYENNDLKHTVGVLSMARAMDKDSAGSQFFIMVGDHSSLDGEYAAFGNVISGIDIVKNISKVITDSSDKPKEDVIIESITVDTKGVDYSKPKKVN